MATDQPRDGDVRFYGDAKVFYMTVCTEPDCDITLPFATAELRDQWADGHAEATGHRVRHCVDVRPDVEHVMALARAHAEIAQHSIILGCAKCARTIKQGMAIIAYGGRIFHVECLPAYLWLGFDSEPRWTPFRHDGTINDEMLKTLGFQLLGTLKDEKK